MRITTLIILAVITLFTVKNLHAQVQLSIRLHPIVGLTVDDKYILCETRDKDLYVSYPLDTFIVPQGELLRFELLDIDERKTYTLFYNYKTETILTKKKPYFIAHPKRGRELHRLTLKITNTTTASCRDISESILLQLEPM